MPDRRAFSVGTIVEDRQGSRAVVEREPWDGFGGVFVQVRWFESLSVDTVEGATSTERIDNLTIVR
jgi:hypothetical protein